MRSLYKIMDRLYDFKIVVRFARIPGNFNFSVYNYEGKNYFYDAPTFEELQTKVFTDFGHLVNPAPTVTSIPKPSFPVPGFPKP